MKRKRAADLSTPIEAVIRTFRGERVILDTDLARIYGVETRVLNQAVKRKIKKFPADFMFRLSRSDSESLAHSRSPSVIGLQKHKSGVEHLLFVVVSRQTKNEFSAISAPLRRMARS